VHETQTLLLVGREVEQQRGHLLALQATFRTSSVDTCEISRQEHGREALPALKRARQLPTPCSAILAHRDDARSDLETLLPQKCHTPLITVRSASQCR
jgi:hypothetical protein